MDKRIKVICDCDNTGSFPRRPMDDALAILYLLGNNDDFDLLGITCNYGNGTSEESYISNKTLLSETGYTEVPVLRGFEVGENPVCESSEFIARMADRYSGELVYLGIGSLGNLYGAYLIDNGIFDKLAQIVLMGGITQPLFIHDSKPLDELNFSVNALASATVLSKGHNISVITGNNCLPVSELPKDEFLSNLCSSENPAGMYIAQKCNESEANNIINIPVARSRTELQEIFYSSWLSLDMHTSDANFSCKGLYLDKLIQPCILIELSKEPCYGFLLMKRLIEDGYADESLDPTGFYRNLKKMEKDGYLISESTGQGTKAKRIFSITDFGKQALLNWEDSLRRYGKHVSGIVSGIENLHK